MSKIVTPVRKLRSSDPVGVTFLNLNSPGVLAGTGYHRLLDAPEVASAIWAISDLIGSMPIHLMENRANGNVRIHDNLARKIDFAPWSLGTRQTWMQWIVETALTRDDAIVIPKTTGSLISDLIPAPGAVVARDPHETGYHVEYKGHTLSHDNILHFKVRPDPDQPWKGQGIRVQLSQVVDSLIQTADTKQAYMSSEYMPPIIVSVNTDNPLQKQSERDAFAAKYMSRSSKGAPLVIPGELMKFEQVKPLSLTDLAIKDGIELDKKTVASVIGVPGFLLGVGSFNKEEWNSFISRKILPICRGIEQELTRKLLLSESRFFRLNARALYSYSLTELATIAKDWRGAGLMTGNEARNWIELAPIKGLDELVMLENYIPAAMLGDQSKLNGANPNKEEPPDV